MTEFKPISSAIASVQITWKSSLTSSLSSRSVFLIVYLVYVVFQRQPKLAEPEHSSWCPFFSLTSRSACCLRWTSGPFDTSCFVGLLPHIIYNQVPTFSPLKRLSDSSTPFHLHYQLPIYSSHHLTPGSLCWRTLVILLLPSVSSWSLFALEPFEFPK